MSAALAQSPPRSRRALRDGVEIAYAELGAGPRVLLLLPGIGSRRSDWGPTLPGLLASRCRVLMVDHRGSGESSVTPPDFDLEDLAHDAVAVLNDAGVARCHVLGFSMGGMVAQLLALDHPERVDRLALVNTHFGGQEVHSPTERADQIVRPRSYRGDGDLAQRSRENFEILTASGFAAAHPELADRFVRGVLEQPTSALGFMGQMKATVLSDRSQRVAGIAAPTLVVHSRDDEVSPLVNGELLAARIPGARLEILEGSGHFAMWDRPEALAEAVLAFLTA